MTRTLAHAGAVWRAPTAATVSTCLVFASGFAAAQDAEMAAQFAPDLITAAGVHGSAGTGRVASAWPTGQGHVTTGFALGFFTGADFIADGTQDSFVGGRISVAWAALPWLEPFLRLELGRNFNSSRAASAGYAGDAFPGVKASVAFGDFAVGTLASASLFVGGNSFLYDLSGTGLDLRALLTWAPESMGAERPLRVHANLGLLLDNSRNLVAGALDPLDRFTARISDYYRAPLGLGVEWLAGRFAVAVDLLAEAPLGAPAGTEWPAWVAPSARLMLYDGLYAFTAAELGVSGRPDQGFPDTMPWFWQLGVSWTFLPFGKHTVELRDREVRVHGGRVKGLVRDARTGAAVPGATVAFPESGLSSLLADEQGRFTSGELEAGERDLAVEAFGYEKQEVRVDVPRQGEVSIEVPLSPVAQEGYGHLDLTVVDEKGAPARALLTFPRARGAEKRDWDIDGRGDVALPPGPYYAEFRAEGRLVTGRSVAVPRAGRTAVRVVLSALGAERAEVRKDRIVIRERIQFQLGQDALLDESLPVLDQVVDALLRHGDLKVRVEGHTDESGTPEFNRDLSLRRAFSVVGYLVSRGVAQERLDGVGHGSSRPLAPNGTEEGRAANRRVEFVIVEGDGR